ncbi:MAG TPA: serine hydrolase domain-containing protein [Candidatus Elarobacter sp.]|jgi:CubicO group peptidase (beta-lactamase class C family)
MKSPAFRIASAALALYFLAAATPDETSSNAAATVAKEMSAMGVPGAEVCILRSGEVVLNEAFGFSDVEAKTPMTARTLMLIASDSKMFTGFALQVLAAKGIVDLKAPISRYDPGLPAALGRATLFQLLSHTAGVKDGATDLGLHDDDALGKAVAASAPDLLFTEPGQIFSYSNLGFDLAGYLLERVHGKPFPDALNDVVFAPAGMMETTARLTTAVTFPFAKGYRNNRSHALELVRPFPDNAAQRPSGGVFTTASDFCRFLQIVMNHGRSGDVQIFPESAVRAFLSPQAQSEPGDDHPSSYGSGLNFVDLGGTRVLQHAGSIAGFGSLVRFEPTSKFAIVILTNKTSGLLLETYRSVSRSVLGYAVPAPVKSPEPLAMSAAERTSYAGRYVNDLKYLAIDLTARGDGLYLQQVGSTDPPTVVSKLGPGRFISDGEPFSIVLDREGTPKYLVIVSHALARQAAGRRQLLSVPRSTAP